MFSSTGSVTVLLGSAFACDGMLKLGPPISRGVPAEIGPPLPTETSRMIDVISPASITPLLFASQPGPLPGKLPSAALVGLVPSPSKISKITAMMSLESIWISPLQSPERPP